MNRKQVSDAKPVFPSVKKLAAGGLTWCYLLLLAVGFSTVWTISRISDSTRYPASNDSTGYVEEARNVVSGHGLKRTARWHQYDVDLIPSVHFPPGYSLMIAAVSALGPDPRSAAIWISRFAWALLPAAIFFALQSFIGTPMAICVGVLSLFSPGAYEFGYLALTDIPFLLLCVLSLGLLLRASSNIRPAAFHVVLAGLIAGLAYATRNAGVAALAAVVAAFVLAIPLKVMPARKAVRAALLWLLGWTAVAGFLVTWNVTRFGQLQPYASGPSDYGFLDSARIYLWSLLLDLTALRPIAQLAWDYKWLMVFGVPVGLLFSWGIFRAFRASSPATQFCILILGLYCAAGSAMIVLGRARFDWVETSLLRHAMQYSWAVLALVVIVIRGTSPPSRLKAVSVLTAAGLLIVSRAGAIYQDQEREAQIHKAFAAHQDPWQASRHVSHPDWVLTNQLKVVFSRNTEMMRIVKDMPDDAYIVSNFGSLLSFETGRSIRNIPIERLPDNAVFQDLHAVAVKVSATRPFYCVILPTNRILKEDSGGDWQSVVTKSLGHGFTLVEQAPEFLVFQFNQESDDVRFPENSGVRELERNAFTRKANARKWSTQEQIMEFIK